MPVCLAPPPARRRDAACSAGEDASVPQAVAGSIAAARLARSSDAPVAVAGTEQFHGRTFFFYTRAERAWVRTLPPRSRAVRH